MQRKRRVCTGIEINQARVPCWGESVCGWSATGVRKDDKRYSGGSGAHGSGSDVTPPAQETIVAALILGVGS